MGLNKIEIEKVFLQSIAEDYSKTVGIIDFVSQQLLIMHNNSNGDTKHSPSVTVYQLHAMLETLDGRLMERETFVRNHLGEPVE